MEESGGSERKCGVKRSLFLGYVFLFFFCVVSWKTFQKKKKKGESKKKKDGYPERREYKSTSVWKRDDYKLQSSL